MVSPNGFTAIPVASTNIINTLHMNSVEQGQPNSQMSHSYRLAGCENPKYNETMTYIMSSFKVLFVQSKTWSNEAKH